MAETDHLKELISNLPLLLFLLLFVVLFVSPEAALTKGPLLLVLLFFVVVVINPKIITDAFMEVTKDKTQASETAAFVTIVFIFALILASKDLIIITIAVIFLLMRVITRGPRKPTSFEDSIESKWWPQYP
jgi:ABC-type multidrug transport system fused ATPase/permease subunit